MARIMLVANPAASQFTGGDHRTILGMLGNVHMVEAVWPDSADDAQVIAADAVTAGFDGVVAMGGDGIVHRVAQALVGSEVYLGVIPAGTTNVFAQQIGIGGPPARAARHLAGDAEIRPMPVVTVEAMRADGTAALHHALFATGVGVDADIVAAAETEPYRKYRFGAVHYARTAIGLLWSDFRRRKAGIVVRTSDRSARTVAVMVQFHPAFTYVGRRGLSFRPGDPEPMTALIVRELPIRRLPSLLRAMALRRSLDTVRGLDVWTGLDRLEVSTPVPARLQADGELLGEVVSASMTHRPDALWVASPLPRRRRFPSLRRRP